MVLNDTNNYLSWANKMRYIDVAMLIARNKAVPLTIGGGLLFDADEPNIIDFLNDFYEKNKIYEKLQMWEYTNSLIGRSVMFMYKNENGEFNFRLLSPNQTNRVGKIDEIEQVADLWMLTGNIDNPVMEHWVWTKDYYVIETHLATEAMINAKVTEINPATKPIKRVVYKNDFGRIPLIETYNLPTINWTQSNTMRQNPDCLPAWKLLVDIQENWMALRKEREMNRTRIFWGMNQDSLIKYINGNMSKELIADGFLMSNDGVSTNGVADNVVVQGGDPKFETYIMLQDYDMKQLYNASGYDYQSFNDSNYTNKTESLMNNKLDMQTTTIKQQLRKQSLLVLFDSLLISSNLWDGQGERPYSFKFIDSSLVDNIRENEIITSRLQNGTLSLKEAIMRYDNLNSKTAESKLKEIEQDQQKKMQQEIEQNKALMVNSNNEINKQQLNSKDSDK